MKKCPDCFFYENEEQALFCEKCGQKLIDADLTSQKEVKEHNLNLISTSYGEFVTADLPLRFLASIIDFILISIIHTFLSSRTSANQAILFYVMLILYLFIFEGFGFGGTIGKKFARIEVRKDNGAKITVTTAFLRSISTMLIFFTFFGGFFFIGFSKKNQGIHDIITGTIVVRKNR
ncbi:MAG: RDD family protein [Candidatus Muiribacteriota bacterium]